MEQHEFWFGTIGVGGAREDERIVARCSCYGWTGEPTPTMMHAIAQWLDHVGYSRRLLVSLFAEVDIRADGMLADPTEWHPLVEDVH